MRIESLDEIIYKSIANAVENIESSYGINHSNWKWGDAHSVTHRHLLSKVRFLNWLFDLGVGPYRTGGSDKTPNAGGYSFHKPYHQTSGASMRRIVDFSNLNETQFILPTGQSGIPGSPHYRDQAQLYHSGQYRTTWFEEDYIRTEENFRHLVLKP
jgi:penicillin amidase